MAQINYQNQEHASLANMLIKIDDLPPNLKYTQITDPPPGLNFPYENSSFDKSLTVFSVYGSRFNETLAQEIFWFGSNEYAHCRFNQLTDNFVIVPDVLAKGSEGVMKNKNIFGIDAITCNGMAGHRETVACVWVGLYDGYVTIVSSPIEPMVVTYNEFFTIISSVNQKMKLELDIR